MSRECRHTTFSRHSSDILSTLNTTRDNSVDISLLPFANAGRPARTGMILTLFSGAAPVEAVNPDWLRAPLRPGIAPVVAGTGSVPAEHRYTVTPPELTSYGNAPVSPRPSPVMPRRSPSECRYRSGRAPVF
ncbi:hypothetical protein DPMN_171072 [Dreissena polymorpha]|uniref:Uncharacterized protein n=1 Tax=Dreissena polymorpha TaxID=45954 RepID=A0A9D4DZP1_DREPO|nr:hypothetical protein DPMN_171072 [Dreissena polymorpha]